MSLFIGLTLGIIITTVIYEVFLYIPEKIKRYYWYSQHYNLTFKYCDLEREIKKLKKIKKSYYKLIYQKRKRKNHV